MPSKREKKKWRKHAESQAFLLDVHLANLMYEELKFDAKVRKKALKMAKKRKPTDYIT